MATYRCPVIDAMTFVQVDQCCDDGSTFVYQLAQLCSDLTGEFIGEDFIGSGFHPVENLPDHIGGS